MSDNGYKKEKLDYSSLASKAFHNKDDGALFKEMRILIESSNKLDKSKMGEFEQVEIDKHFIDLLQNVFIPRLLENNELVTDKCAGDLSCFIHELFDEFNK